LEGSEHEQGIEPTILHAKAYELVLEYRSKRVNSVDILRRLEYLDGGRAEMDIPLCRMISLQVVLLLRTMCSSFKLTLSTGIGLVLQYFMYQPQTLRASIVK
jgi:hypothetical protein